MPINSIGPAKCEVRFADGSILELQDCKVVGVTDSRQPIESLPSISDTPSFREFLVPDVFDIQVQMDFKYNPFTYDMIQRLKPFNMRTMRYQHRDKWWEQDIQVTLVGPDYLTYTPIGEPREAEDE